MIHKHGKSCAHPDWPKTFGSLTADWMIAKNGVSAGIDTKRYCMLVYDLGTHFVMAYPIGFTYTDEAYMALKHYAGPPGVERFYSDRGGELISSAKLL